MRSKQRTIIINNGIALNQKQNTPENMCDVCHRWNARCSRFEENIEIDKLLKIDIEDVTQDERRRKRRYGDMAKLHDNELRGKA